MAQEKYHHGNLKKTLISEGLKLLNEVGYESFSLRKVAKECGVSHTAPYRHFKNKDELIVEITLEAVSEFRSTLKNATTNYTDDLKNQLNELGFQYIKFFVENGEYLKLLYNEKIISQVYALAKDKISEETPFSIFFNTAIMYLRKSNKNNSPEACQNKDIQTIDIEAFILEKWGLVHGIAILISQNLFVCEGNPLDVARKVIFKNMKGS